MKTRRWGVLRWALALVVMVVGGVSKGAEETAVPLAAEEAASPSLQERVEARWEADRAAYAGRETEVMVRRGLVADRVRRQITLLAAPTGLAANGNVEFMLVAAGSGHHYEAFAYAFAAPSALREALLFIGLPPGRPPDWAQLAFWPKGERVLATVRGLDPGVLPEPIRLERLVWNPDTRAPMREAGFIFTGSRWEGGVAGGGLLADLRDPMAMIANYNEPDAVLDMPRVAPQHAVYTSQMLHPDYVLATNRLLEVTLVPERPPERPRVLDLELLQLPEGEAGGAGTEPWFALREIGTETPAVVTNAVGVLAWMAGAVAAGRDPYVRLGFDAGARLSMVHTLCQLFAGAEGEDGIRMEPPAAGSLYYKAYLPDEANRRREARIAQPWELHLAGTEGKVEATLTAIKEHWKVDQLRPELEIVSTPVATPAELRTRLDAALREEFEAALTRILVAERRALLAARLAGLDAAGLWGEEGQTLRREIDFEAEGFAEDKVLQLRVLLVFADPALRHGQLMAFVEAIRATHPTVHVYLTPGVEAEGAEAP